MKKGIYDFINTSSDEEGFIIFLIATFFCIFFLIATTIYLTVDPLSFRTINQFVVTDNSDSSNIGLNNVISEFASYEGMSFDYDEKLRDINTKISGEIKIKSLEIIDSSNKIKIISDEFVAYANGYKPNSIVLWVNYDEEVDLSKFKSGESIRFIGFIDSINSSYIIVSKGEILYD